jgi:hypothetical protein
MSEGKALHFEIRGDWLYIITQELEEPKRHWAVKLANISYVATSGAYPGTLYIRINGVASSKQVTFQNAEEAEKACRKVVYGSIVRGDPKEDSEEVKLEDVVT